MFHVKPFFVEKVMEKKQRMVYNKNNWIDNNSKNTRRAKFWEKP